MIASLRNLSDRVFGRGEFSASVPPMDGALQPNNRIEQAKALAACDHPGNLVICGETIFFSDGPQMMRLAGGGLEKVGAAFATPITAMTENGGRLAVALDDGTVWYGPPDAVSKTAVQPIPNITALDFIDAETLVVAVGSIRNAPRDWTRDLLERRRLGEIWRVPLDGTGATRLAQRLAYPAGIFARDGRIFVSEAWRHRIVEITEQGQVLPVLAHLPGYPGQISAAGDGAMLAVFAPRSQLIEFVLRQTAYRKRMMDEVPPPLWVAPALGSGRSFLEPLQGGSVKQMGILKPWAPTRSYGLVVELDRDFHPLQSLHSRADGKRHGITSAVRRGDQVVMASRGSGEILTTSMTDGEGA